MSVPPDDPYRGMTHAQYLDAWKQDQAALEEFFHDDSSLDEARWERYDGLPDWRRLDDYELLREEIARVSRRLLGLEPDGTDRE